MNVADPDLADPGPFGIDDREHSERDREMFALGYEFAETSRAIRAAGSSDLAREFARTVHAANVARLAAVAAAVGVNFEAFPFTPSWSQIKVGRSRGPA